MAERCPVCSKAILRDLEGHVNECLDSQEWKGGDKLNSDEIDKEKEKVITQEISQETKSTSTKREHKNAFALLGLRADNGSSKSRKIDSKKAQKNRALLTDILIAEKRLQSSEKKIQRTQSDNDESDGSFNDKEVQYVGEESESKTKYCDVEDNSEESIKPLEFDQRALNPKKEASEELLQDKDAKRSASMADEILLLRKESMLPLAQRVRPKVLDDFYGQEHLVGPNGLLRNLIVTGSIPSFILWGNPGIGKTSLARIIGKSLKYRFVEVSGSEGNAKTLKEVFSKAETDAKLKGLKTILFLDEIHRFNKAVQDLLLPVVEKGVLTVIGATTENPSFSLNSALLSRMHTFTMKPLTENAIMRILYKGLYHINRTRKYINGLCNIALKKDGSEYIAKICGGDSRMALNILETVHVFLSQKKFSLTNEGSSSELKDDKVVVLSSELLRPLLKTKNYHQIYDRKGDGHYDTISAFHKSVRGSDPDAAIFYLTKMLVSGEDPLFIARRMVVIASEDVGLRNSNCLPFAMAAKEAVEFIGMPEGEIILAHCAVKLAMEPKSTKSYRALRSAQSYLRENPEVSAIPIPIHLRNAPTALMKELGYGESYKYNPNFKHGIVRQSYLPSEINEVKFLEKQHLGLVKDEDVPKKVYTEAEKEAEEFEVFKEEELAKLQDKFKDDNENSVLQNKKTRPTRIAHELKDMIKDVLEENPSLLSNLKNFKDTANEVSAAREDNAGVRKNCDEYLNNSKESEIYSYDEFLSKEDQPKYFDGEEKDEYSDDPDCSNNFEKGYDEFLSKEEQPEYFDADFISAPVNENNV